MTLLVIFQIFLGLAQADWQSEVMDGRKSHEESVRKNWLVLVGLHWLREGSNTVGSAGAVSLPAVAPKNLGTIFFKKDKTEIEFATVTGVTLDGKAVVAKKKYPLLPDTKGKSVVKVGTIEFHVVERAKGYGVRVKDSESETLKTFGGFKYWELKPEYRVVGIWKPFSTPKKMRIPDVTGATLEEPVEGVVEFTLEGKTHQLYPTKTNDDLFFVFKDSTSGKASYGTGRFLGAKLKADGKVEIDFNTAENPPCAYVKYATCPMAPAENNLKTAIEAGEKTTH